jgi:hypothetical protein
MAASIHTKLINWPFPQEQRGSPANAPKMGQLAGIAAAEVRMRPLTEGARQQKAGPTGPANRQVVSVGGNGWAPEALADSVAAASTSVKAFSPRRMRRTSARVPRCPKALPRVPQP